MAEVDEQAVGPDRDPSHPRIRRGGCTCGAVRFEVVGEPSVVGLCLCADCRKETGSPFLFYADWPRDAFTVTGAFSTYAGRSFCSRFGSRLFHLGETEAEILLGSLDDAPGDLTPAREGWIVRREHWLAPVAHAGQADGDPA
jgi:hypothetical protein